MNAPQEKLAALVLAQDELAFVREIFATPNLAATPDKWDVGARTLKKLNEAAKAFEPPKPE